MQLDGGHDLIGHVTVSVLGCVRQWDKVYADFCLHMRCDVQGVPLFSVAFRLVIMFGMLVEVLCCEIAHDLTGMPIEHASRAESENVDGCALCQGREIGRL